MHFDRQISRFGHGWGAGEGFDFVGEALDIGFGGAFGLFLFRQGGRLRVGVVPVHQIAAAVEFRVVAADAPG
jgi:hypothetical protein